MYSQLKTLKIGTNTSKTGRGGGGALISPPSTPINYILAILFQRSVLDLMASRSDTKILQNPVHIPGSGNAILMVVVTWELHASSPWESALRKLTDWTSPYFSIGCVRFICTNAKTMEYIHHQAQVHSLLLFFFFFIWKVLLFRKCVLEIMHMLNISINVWMNFDADTLHGPHILMSRDTRWLPFVTKHLQHGHV